MTGIAVLDHVHAVTAEPALPSGAVILSEAVPLGGTAEPKACPERGNAGSNGDLHVADCAAAAKEVSATEAAFAAITPTLIRPLFPFTPLDNIAANLPHVLTALAAANLTDTPMLLAALATIRAEAEPFLPLTEAESPYNTSPGGHAAAASGSPGAASGHPFDLYDHRADLGNQGPPDGASFRGRGYVQLTGRFNYTHYGRTLALDLLTNPSLAADPAPAARILAAFLAEKQTVIRAALAAKDLAHARRLVNGGSNGLARFTAAYTAGLKLFG